ncbi:MAG: ATP-binding cassette domain-containing protein [Candidatus Aminicenantales bacterium]
MNEIVIQTKGLTVRFGRKTALSGLSVSFVDGETAIIAGSNGGGKSTFLRCLAGVIVPDRGEVVPGPGLTREKIGFISDRMSLYEGWTLREAWRFHRKEYGIETDKPAPIDGFELGESRKIKDLSAGERTLFHLTLLLAQRPRLLLIDEVVHALDPFLREKFLETVIEAIDAYHTAVLMVNHTLTDTAQIPERILIMDGGRFILDERREDLEQKVKKVSGEAVLPPDIPCIFTASSEYRRESYIYPFREEFRGNASLDFQDIALDEIVKAFIGGVYVQKRTR